MGLWALGNALGQYTGGLACQVNWLLPLILVPLLATGATAALYILLEETAPRKPGRAEIAAAGQGSSQKPG